MSDKPINTIKAQSGLHWYLFEAIRNITRTHRKMLQIFS